jgi:hypothetical protein
MHLELSVAIAARFETEDVELVVSDRETSSVHDHVPV